MTSARHVVVTGGSRGLGLAIVKTLAARGYRVTAVARSPNDELAAASAAPQLLTSGGSITFRPFDLAATGEIAGFVRALRKDAGAIYGLINNAGVGTSGTLGLMADDRIERLVRMNTLSPLLLTKYVVRSMMADKQIAETGGRVINIASIVASTGYSGLSVYSATKASLIGFTRSLAREVGSLGITVNAVAPGFVATDMTEELDPAQRDRIARRSALGRLVEPLDVARSVEFLLGEGGRNITGTVLTVDAGNTA